MPGCSPRKRLKNDGVVQHLAPDMNCKDLFRSFQPGFVDHNMPVKPSRPQKGRIQHIRPVVAAMTITS